MIVSLLWSEKRRQSHQVINPILWWPWRGLTYSLILFPLYSSLLLQCLESPHWLDLICICFHPDWSIPSDFLSCLPIHIIPLDSEHFHFSPEDGNMKFMHQVDVSGDMSLDLLKTAVRLLPPCLVKSQPPLCHLSGFILFPWFCVIVLALPITRIIFIFFPSQRLLWRLVEATQRSVPQLTCSI